MKIQMPFPVSAATAWDKYYATHTPYSSEPIQARFTAYGGEYRSVPDNHSWVLRYKSRLWPALHLPGIYIAHCIYICMEAATF